MKRNRKSCWIVLAIIGVFALMSCEKNPASPSSPTQKDSFAKTAASTGVEVYRNIQTFEQIAKAMAGPGALGIIKLPAVGSLQKSGANFRQALLPFYQHAQTLTQRASRLQKTNGDSILLDQRWTDPQTGIAYHLWISYNTVSGKATVYTVATKHPSRSPLARDSTRLVVDTNFTIADNKDDVVELLENAKDYRAGYRLRYEEGRIIPDKYQPGSEPKGGVIEAKSLHASGQDTTEVQQRLEYHETANPVGSWVKTVSFRDGTHYSEDITFRPHSVIFNIAYRDGTREQGQFNSPDENHLFFEKRVAYPSGSDPRSIFEKGDFSRNPADNSGTANFTREEFFADGSSKRRSVNINASKQNGFVRLEVTESNSDGTGGSWTLQDGPAKAGLKGNWINEQKQYILFDGAFYKDGSGDLHIEVYASKEAYDKGEPPIFKADLHFRPDGSGSGTITSKDGISQFSFSANGTPRS
ncbi:MAG: hypothetical protein ONB46_14825 [candidate division KSB1 bacterium]|nr:hypothetical protein [candidate division KSB1 bacterium]MDZ7367035.1 hypothetical protein [candidate division KSB1 bacterium]MDZ7406735.1 hypothetical protein [candidate division KSB1 bacterium]